MQPLVLAILSHFLVILFSFNSFHVLPPQSLPSSRERERARLLTADPRPVRLPQFKCSPT